MAQKLILESTLSNIADAIRSKDGTTELIDPADFAARISAISTGIAEPKAIVVVEAPVGSEVTATNGTDTLTGTVGATESFFLLLPSSGA